MATENKHWLAPFSPEDEKEAQKELARLRKNEKGAFKTTRNWTGFKGKTLWDWLQLLGVLAIPIVVVGATIAFGVQQANLAQKQHDFDQGIANQQHKADQQQALDQQRAAILQTYIDNIQDLLLNHNLLKSKPTEDVAVLARARTLTALQGLDPVRKSALVKFLYEAHLIGFLDSKNKLQPPIVNLDSADLSNVLLNFAPLNGANLSNVILDDASLSFAKLSDSNLSNSRFFCCADLSNADLTGADLTGANLIGADLTNAILTNAILTQQQLDQVISCQGAMLPKGLICHNTPSPSP